MTNLKCRITCGYTKSNIPESERKTLVLTAYKKCAIIFWPEKMAFLPYGFMPVWGREICLSVNCEMMLV